MGEEEMVTKVPEAVANGISETVKSGEVAKKKDEDNEMTAMEEDEKDKEKAEDEKMDYDPEEEEDKEKTEENAAEDKKEEELKTKTSEETNGPQGNEKIEEKEEGKEALEEKADGLKEVEEGEKRHEGEEEDDEEEKEKKEEKKGSKKRVRGKSSEKKSGGDKVEKKKKVVQEKKEPEPRTPAIDRPQRERKSVERLVASVDRDASKEFQIEKGRGTPLKDIPNVALKLSRRKTDDTFKLLHTILFGRRGKAIQVKSNILRFSGFVWHKDEEKHMIKVKEKFDKCNKEKLLEFCDVFDIPIAKASAKKEDIIAKLIDFLMAPYATATDLHTDKEKGSKSNKRKRVDKSSTSGSASSKPSAKSRKKAETASKKSKKSKPDSEDEMEEEMEEEEEEEEEENENGLPEKSDLEMPEPSESEEKVESEEESEDYTKKQKRTKSSSGKGSAGKTKTKKATVSNKTNSPRKRTPKRSSVKHTEVDDDSDAAPKASSKKKKNEPAAKKSSSPAKSAAKERTDKKAVRAKEKVPVKEKSKPSDDELRDATCEILKDVDFNTATFTDILKLLAKRFDTDLTPRKSSIKLMIQEELTKLADEADDEEGEADADKNDNQAAGKEVEA